MVRLVAEYNTEQLPECQC